MSDELTLVFESDAAPRSERGLVRASASLGEKSVAAADGAFRKALKSVVGQTAGAFMAALDELERRPSSAELKFGLNAAGEAGFIIAKGSVTANISVAITWQNLAPADPVD